MGKAIPYDYRKKIIFDPHSKQWVFRSANGNHLKSSVQAVPNEKQIKEFAIMSKNLDTKI